MTDGKDPLQFPYPPLRHPGQSRFGSQASGQAKRPEQEQKPAKEPRFDAKLCLSVHWPCE